MTNPLKIFSSSNITDLDASEILAKLTNYISQNNSKFRWQHFYESTAGMMTLEVMAGLAEYLIFLIERKQQESVVDTASLKSSVYMLAATQGIVPKRKKAAKGLVTLVFSRPLVGDVTLDIFDGTGNLTYNSLTYAPATTVTIPNGSVTFTTWYIQGSWIYVDNTSAGTPYEQFLVEEKDWMIDNDEFYVYYQGGYKEYAPWPNVPTTDQVSVKTHYSGGVQVVTGDGNIGKQFNSGDVIKLVYLKTDGIQGNITLSSTDCALEIGSFIANDNSGPVTVTAYLESSFTGGKDETNVEYVKQAYNDILAQSNTVVTDSDMVKLIKTIPGFDDVKLCSTGGCCSMGLCVVKSDESDLNDEDLKKLNLTVSPSMTPTALPTYSTATKVNVNYTFSVSAKAGYDLAAIHNAIRNYLTTTTYHKLGAKFDVAKYMVEISKLDGITGIEINPCNSTSVQCCQFIGLDNITINIVNG